MKRVPLAALALLLAACGSSVNQANYDKIQNGMTLSQVEAILGKATDTSSVGVGPLSGTAALWRDKKSGAVIRVQLVNGEVRGKQYTQ